MSLGGAGFPSSIYGAGIGQIQLFLRHWRTPQTQSGRLVRIALKWAQHGVGTSAPILQDVLTPLPQMEVIWLKSLRIFLASIGAQIEVDDPGVAVLQRTHDFFLMDMVLQRGSFQTTKYAR
jgi:hypothetical protein